MRNRLSNLMANPTAKKVGIGTVVVGVAGGIAYGVNHFIGKPLAAGAREFKKTFSKVYAEEKAARANA